MTKQDVISRSPPGEDLPFKVETWTAGGSVDRVLCRAARVDLARGAYDVACVAFPGMPITLRHGIRVIAERK